MTDLCDLCDRCQQPFQFDDLTFVETLPRTWFHEEEGVMLCTECIGERDE